MPDYKSDQLRHKEALDLVLKELEHMMHFKCNYCGKFYDALSTDNNWSICPRCGKDGKP